jgi:hypothetical protein
VVKENLKTILFIASITLNAVFAVTYLSYKLPSLAGWSQPAPQRPLFLQLDLTADQLPLFKTERDKFHTRLQELGQEIKKRQLELIDLLGTTPPDRQSIEIKQAEIQQLQEAAQDCVIVHILQESALLNPEQRSRFFQLIKARTETSAQVCPPWMRPGEQGRPGGTRDE